MDGSNPNEQPKLELPIASTEPARSNDEHVEKSGDSSSVSPEIMQPVAGNSLPQTAPIAQQAPQPASPLQATSVSTVGVAAPLVAEDADLIEKEWVLKAKQIVDKTKYDPYLQNKEMGKFKADYLKKRYNKTITTVEE
jgi:hypothetical protein